MLKSITINDQVWAPESRNLFAILHNTVPRDTDGGGRPEVFRPETECYYSWIYTEAWQRYHLEVLSLELYGLPTEALSFDEYIYLAHRQEAIVGDNKFIANGNGLKTGANHILQTNLDQPDPEIYTLFCGGGVLSGELRDNDKYLYYQTMDAEGEPPSIDEVNPYTHPWLFVVATNITSNLIDGLPVINPFTMLGGRYTGKSVYVPLCSIHERGEMWVAVWDAELKEQRIKQLAPGAPIPNPYRPPME